MALFGKKSNQQSNTTDVPPELQPYYQKQSKGAWLRRAALFILPILVVLLLLAGAAWGLIWINRHKAAAPHPNSNSQTAQNNHPQAANNSQQGSDDNGSSSGQNGSSSGQSSQASSSTGSTPANNAGNSNSSTQGATPDTIPSTGPDGSIFGIAALVGVTGAVAYHIRQTKRAQQKG